MRFSRQRFRMQLEQLPMFRVLLPVVCAILLVNYLSFPLWLLVAGVVVAGVLMVAGGSDTYALLFLLFGSMLSAELHFSEPKPPYDQVLMWWLRPESEVVERREYASVVAEVEAWQDVQGCWHGSGKRVMLYCDSTLRPSAGERLLLCGPLRPFTTRHEGYASLMEHRGFAGTMGASERRVVERDTTPRFALTERMHRGAVERLERLDLSPESRALVLAMAAGEKRGLTDRMRQAYSRSGTSHLLALSGLHVGILFLVVNLLLGWLSLFRGGHLLRHALSIGVIWLFAFTVGLSPSVVRAACMFSLLQISLIFSLQRDSLNILFAVAVVMLLFRPSWLFDPSFQLSFLAVAAILSWAQPVMRHAPRRLGGSLVVGLFATLATAPLISLQFGVVSLAGVVVNPPIILLTEAIVSLSLGWMALPWSWLRGPVGWLIEHLASWQNGVVEWVAAQPLSALDFRLSRVATLLIYAGFVAFTLILWGLESKKTVSLSHDDKRADSDDVE